MSKTGKYFTIHNIRNHDKLHKGIFILGGLIMKKISIIGILLAMCLAVSAVWARMRITSLYQAGTGILFISESDNLINQHRIAVTEKTVSAAHRVFVTFKDQILSRES